MQKCLQPFDENLPKEQEELILRTVIKGVLRHHNDDVIPAVTGIATGVAEASKLQSPCYSLLRTLEINMYYNLRLLMLSLGHHGMKVPVQYSDLHQQLNKFYLDKFGIDLDKIME